MAKNEEKKDGFSPVHATHPDPNTVQCSTCKYRDKAKLKFSSGTEVAIGAIKAFCEKYKKPPKSNGKPHDVLYNIQRCEFYEMEE